MSGKSDLSSTLQAESIRTSLQRLEIGILSVSTHESCVCWDVFKAFITMCKTRFNEKMVH